VASSLITSGDGGCKAQGETPGFFSTAKIVIFLFSVSFAYQVNGDDSNSSKVKVFSDPETRVEQTVTVTKNKRRAEFRTFVPEKKEYTFELGGMWEEQNLYWMGVGMGLHIGRCFLSESQSCQQYWDVLAGAGGRDGQTNGLLLTGPRWQFVNFPSAISPYVKLLIGVMDVRDDERDFDRAAGIMGFGWTVSVHENLDLRFEGRVGWSDAVLSQMFIGLNFKMEKWVDYFADKIKRLTGSDRPN